MMPLAWAHCYAVGAALWSAQRCCPLPGMPPLPPCLPGGAVLHPAMLHPPAGSGRSPRLAAPTCTPPCWHLQVRALGDLDPETTLAVIVSKTFTTAGALAPWPLAA